MVYLSHISLNSTSRLFMKRTYWALIVTRNEPPSLSRALWRLVTSLDPSLERSYWASRCLPLI